MFRRFLFMLVVLCLNMATISHAKDPETVSVLALVNRDIITTQDMEERIKMNLALTGMKPDEATFKRLRMQVIQKLVDEALQRQEAKRQSITLSEREREGGWDMLAKSQQKTVPELKEWFRQNGLSLATAQRQMETEMGWSKYLFTRVQPRLQVSDVEMQEAIEIVANERGYDEWRIGELLVPATPNPDQGNTQNPEELAAELIKQIEGGTDFSKLAKQFPAVSGSTTEEDGTRWVSPSQLDQDVAKALETLEPGKISPPIRTAAGVYVIKIHEKRKMLEADPGDTEVAIRQVILPVAPDASQKEVAKQMESAKAMVKDISSCDALTAAAEATPTANVHDLGRLQVRDLDAKVKPIVTPLATGTPSEPFITPIGVHVLMVCERIEARSSAVDKNRIREMIIQKKLGLEAIRIMRNLRREALLELRKPQS
jgi:peptidyl-prolyl cis-trans isomerase SurA